MRQLNEQVKLGNITAGELEAINVRLNELAAQVMELDSESKRTEDGKILE